MFERLWNPLIPYLTAIGLTLDAVGIFIIILENFFPKYSRKIDRWLSQISYIDFTSRLERPLFFIYGVFYKYLLISAFIFFVTASSNEVEIVKEIIDDKRDFFLAILGYFMGYMLVALVSIWWLLPMLFIFSSKVMYKNKPLTGCGFMLLIIGIALTLPQI